MKCWICGNRADTGEHKIKKSLLVAVHGKGPYKRDKALVHVKEGKVSPVQGPNSERLKYQSCLCSDCNNRKTKPFDLAYDQFFQFVLDREEQILKYRIIDFVDIYGSDFEVGQRNLFKYFVKLFGCDLAYSGHEVPHDLPLLLDQDAFLTKLRITFAVNEDVIAFPAVRSLGIGDLNTSLRNLSHKDDPKYRWSSYFSFLHVYYWYGIRPDGPFGATWIADSRYLYLGSFYSLTTEERVELKRVLDQTS